MAGLPGHIRRADGNTFKYLIILRFIYITALGTRNIEWRDGFREVAPVHAAATALARGAAVTFRRAEAGIGGLG
jgi:hypothetical protein